MVFLNPSNGISQACGLKNLGQSKHSFRRIIYQNLSCVLFVYKGAIKLHMELCNAAKIVLMSSICFQYTCCQFCIETLCSHVVNLYRFRNIHPLVLDQNYINLKNQVIKAERRILKELGFCVHVKHPHKVAIDFCIL